MLWWLVVKTSGSPVQTLKFKLYKKLKIFSTSLLQFNFTHQICALPSCAWMHEIRFPLAYTWLDQRYPQELEIVRLDFLLQQNDLKINSFRFSSLNIKSKVAFGTYQLT